MNKKGSVVIFILTMLFIFGVLPALYLVSHSKATQFEQAIGEKQLML